MANIEMVWTWANAKSRFAGFWKIGTPLPDGLIESGPLPDKTRKSFERGADAFFAPLKTAQPLTYAALVSCETMCVQLVKHPTLVDVLTTSGELMIFSEPFWSSDEFRDRDDLFLQLPPLTATSNLPMQRPRSMPIARTS